MLLLLPALDGPGTVGVESGHSVEGSEGIWDELGLTHWHSCGGSEGVGRGSPFWKQSASYNRIAIFYYLWVKKCI